MSSKEIVIIVMLFCWAIVFQAQSSADSLQLIWENNTVHDTIRYNALDQYYQTYNQAFPDSTLKTLDYYYNLAEEKDDKRHLFLAAKKIGNISRLKGNYDEAMEAYENAQQLAIELNDTNLQADIMGNIGNVYIYRKDYKEATHHFSKALKVFQKGDDIERECRMLTSLGSVHLIINNLELASDYYQKALSRLNKRGIEDRSTAILYINIGWTYYERDLYEEARAYFEKAIPILNEKNNKFFIADCYSSLAKACHKLNDLSAANDYAEKNLALNQELDMKLGVVDAKIIIAQLAYETNVGEATKKGEEILEDLPADVSKETKRNLFELLYECYKSQGKLDLSLKMHERYTIYKDSIQSEKNNFAVAREAVKNDFDIKLYESKLESEKEKAALKITQLKRTFAIIFISALLILSLLFYFMAKIKGDRKKRDVLLQEIEKMKSNTSSELIAESAGFALNREKIEVSIEKNLNETDWNVLNILLSDPVISNKAIAEAAFMSVDGIGSSLRRMYQTFEIKESRYKKISLLMEAIKRSK